MSYEELQIKIVIAKTASQRISVLHFSTQARTHAQSHSHRQPGTLARMLACLHAYGKELFEIAPRCEDGRCLESQQFRKTRNKVDDAFGPMSKNEHSQIRRQRWSMLELEESQRRCRENRRRGSADQRRRRNTAPPRQIESLGMRMVSTCADLVGDSRSKGKSIACRGSP